MLASFTNTWIVSTYISPIKKMAAIENFSDLRRWSDQIFENRLACTIEHSKDRHTIGKGSSTVTKSEMVPEIKTPKSNILVEPHSLAWTAGLIWSRAEKRPLSPQMAMNAVKKPMVHIVMKTIHAMITGRNFGMLKICR